MVLHRREEREGWEEEKDKEEEEKGWEIERMNMNWSVKKNNTIYILSDLELSNRKKNRKLQYEVTNFTKDREILGSNGGTSLLEEKGLDPVFLRNS